ncbi:MAG: cytochrome c [Candidatus Kapabacteria bacterium]|nr:cytochrome c [Candidatus Kapabacteria bacterium]
MRAIVIAGFFSFLIFLGSCGDSPKTDTQSAQKNDVEKKDPNQYDPHRGEGKFTAENVKVGATLDVAMAKAGAEVREVKCAACHSLKDDRIVGPGWQGVTSRRKPEWLMNFITNPDPMISKDPELQVQLEVCLMRMPNQNLSDDEARQVFEFMRQNDGVK